MGRRKKEKKGRKSPPSSPGRPSARVADSTDAASAFLGEMPDRRAIEGAMRQWVADQMGEESEDSPLNRAQQLMYEAFESQDPRQQIQTAQQALAISPDCADAYALLGDYAGSPQEALQLYEQGVAAGERALGVEAFNELEGHFWGFMETRPYMRARLGLVNALLELREREKAAAHLQDMLLLNPDDNQGARYILLGVLIDLDRDDDAATLINLYPDDCSAEWHYSRALLTFRRGGDTPHSRNLLAEASRVNPHVPPYLAGFKNLPSTQPPYVELGGESEAQSYAANHLRCWKASPGAIPWLRNAAGLSREEPRGPRPSSWSGFPREVTDLSQDEAEVWHVDIRRLAGKGENKATSIWAMLVTSSSRKRVIAVETTPEKPSNNAVLEQLANVMIEPDDDQPRRPGKVRVRLKMLFNAWKKKLAAVSIQCEHESRLHDIDMLYQGMVAQLEEQVARSNAAALSDEQFDELPQVAEEVWHADVRQLAAWIGDEASPARPWLAIAFNQSEGKIPAQELAVDQSPKDLLTKVIRQALSSPAVGDPHRPGRIDLRKDIFDDKLAGWLAKRNIDCDSEEDFDALEFIYDDFTRHMSGDEPAVALLDAPGVEPQHVAAVFDAAADFYRRKPWRSIPGDVPIRIASDQFESGPWYGVVMGQIGVCEGIALYEDRDALTKMLTGQTSDAENARTMSALSLQYNEPFEIPNLDLHHAEKYGWSIAGPEAYPTIMRVETGMVVRPPSVWELQLMEACLRAVLEFLAAGNDAPREVEVETSAGPIRVTVSSP